tara:strand:+ start:1217 stop:1447 length:231 start_codon:yes stop_codon:yes gene_type:complete
MAKISNTSAYPFISDLNSKDYLILTDADNSLLTKTVLVATLSDFIVNTGDVKLIAPDNSVWRLQVSNAGVVTAQPA